MAAGPMRGKYGMEPDAYLTGVQFADLWNLVIDDFSRLVPVVIPAAGAGDMDFPWKTLASRYVDITGSPLLWRMDVSLGTVNDVAPPVIYRAKDDPRGWTPPAPLPDGTVIVERSLAELDRPWLLLTAPKPNADPVNTDQFKQVPDTARPAFFRTEDMWEKLLFQASVFLSDTVTDLSGPNLPISILSRLASAIRLSAGQLPKVAAGSEAGVLELARVFLLRDPKDEDGSSDTIMVRQQVYYCLQAELVEPNPAYLISVAGPAGGISNFDQSLATFDFWTA